jgi:hypothetical protein
MIPRAVAGRPQRGQRAQAIRHVQVVPVPERHDPIVYGLAAHREEVSDGRDRSPIVEPRPSSDASQLRGIMFLIQKLQLSVSFPRPELE